MGNGKFPLVFDIKRTSTTDGPGIRTVFFLKGCNLDCFWCHNPEGKRMERSLAFFAEKCTGCGVCKRVCKGKGDACTACGTCAEYCPAEARRIYGRALSIEELVEIGRADLDYYRATGGGVTFSGGECMLFPEFVGDCARRFCEIGISVAIDTAGAVPYSHFEAVLPYADVILYDVKCLDPSLHEQGTGKRNELILENLERLRQTGKRLSSALPSFRASTRVPRWNA